MLTIIAVLLLVTLFGIVGGLLAADYFYFQDLPKRAEEAEKNAENSQN